MNDKFNKGKKGQICQLLEPLGQKTQWINLEDIIIFPNGKPIKLGDFIYNTEKRTSELELELTKTQEDLLVMKTISEKQNSSIEVMLKKYEKLENSVNTLLSLNNKN
jgi:hypothetical protein